MGSVLVGGIVKSREESFIVEDFVKDAKKSVFDIFNMYDPSYKQMKEEKEKKR